MITVEKKVVKNAIKDMILESVEVLGSDVVNKLESALKSEPDALGRSVLSKIIENSQIAKSEGIPLCQDTGLVVCFVEIGRELRFDYDLSEAINEAVGEAYVEGYLRKSVVEHPLARKNTLDNTPAVIHYSFITGQKLIIHIAPKGGGSENMSTLKMLSPADGREGIIDFVLETIKNGGGKPCPPLIVGVGIGGNFEHVAYLAKKAIFRPINDNSSNTIDAELEAELYQKINELNVGPMGFGGKTTCLAVKVNSAPCHIASLPVAVNLQCHSARKREVTLYGKEINHSDK